MTRTTSMETFQQELTATIRAWQDAFDRGDAAGGTAFYTEEAVLRLSSGETLSGKEAPFGGGPKRVSATA